MSSVYERGCGKKYGNNSQEPPGLSKIDTIFPP